MHRALLLSCLAVALPLTCCFVKPHPPPFPQCTAVHDIAYTSLVQRQKDLFGTYPGVNSSNAATFWGGTLNLSQRVEFAGGTKVIGDIEAANHWQALVTVTNIHGSEPNTPSEQQFNNEVTWTQDAASHFANLPGWGEHIALLHPGQSGYQENRDGNPFLGVVVLFDDNPTNPAQPGGQFHIGFRSLLAHYEAENGDIGDAANYQLYATWYGYLDCFKPGP